MGAEETLRESMKWTLTSEELPKIDEEVLFQDDFGEIFIGRLHINDGVKKCGMPII